MSIPLTRRRGARTVGLATAAVVGLGGVSALTSPAHAANAVFQNGGDSGATATTPDDAYVGQAIHLEGTAWTKSAGVAGCVAVKLGNGNGSTASTLSTTQSPAPAATGACVGLSAPDGVYALIPTDATGAFSADLPFPTSSNTSPAVTTSDWAAGTAHQLRLLTGFDGSTPRSAYLDFTVKAAASAPTLSDVTASFSATGASAALSGSGFTAGTVLSAKLGDTALNFSGRNVTAGPTYNVSGTTVSGVNVVLPAGTRAGSYTVTVHGDDGSADGFDVPVKVTVTPVLTWSGGSKAGATGTLTVTGLPTGAVISQVTFGSDAVASTLSTADTDGKATGDYSIPSGTAAGPVTVTLTQTAPSAATYTVAGTVYPDETISRAGQFGVASDANDPALFQGLYQSAYSETEKALFATSGNRGTGEGYLYKLDPDTLEVLKSAHASTSEDDTDRVKDSSGTYGTAQFGIGVDDVNGTVWVTNTGGTGVAVYRASDLTLLKQYPAGTIDHPRDVVYDPKTNYVFVSSASEGATGNGYLEVFEAADNDHDGTPYELVKKLQTGARSTFNPVSLSLDNGTLVSPSLSSNKVAVIDTAKAITSAVPAAADGVDSAVTLIEIGEHSTAGNGRGASGIAYDDADHRLFVASQNDNAVFVADSETGEIIKTVATGQQALNVTYDKVHKLAYVANFGGTSVTVLDKDGNKVAALPVAKANHVSVTDAGIVYAVDKASPVNHVWKITPHLETVGGVDLLDPTINGATGKPATTPLTVTVKQGQSIHISGTNFLTKDGTSGSKIGVKSADISGSPTIATIEADDNGTWSADVAFPSGWVVGDTQNLRLLTGSLKDGDTTRSIAIKVHVTAADAGTTPGTTTPAPTAKEKAAQKVTKDKAKVKTLKKKVKKAKGAKKVKLKKKLAKANKQLKKDKKKLKKLK